MKKLKGILVLILLLALLASPIAVLASNISGASYYGTIIVSNNSTATTNVAVNCTISTENLINGGYLNSSANNCVVRSSAGADLPFMPSVNASYPWCVWVPSIGENSHLSDILYTANSTGGEIRYFPTAEGMASSDNANMELGDNFTVEQSGWWDTDAGANKYAVNKIVAFRTFVSPTVSENITSIIGGGLDFVRANSDWVSIPDHNDFSFTDGAGNDEPFSIVAWVNLDDATTSRLVGKTTANKVEWSLSTSGADLLYLSVYHSDATVYRGRLTGAVTGYQGEWIHIVGTYSGNETCSGFNIYINGVDADTDDFTAGVYTGMTNDSAVVELGSNNAGASEYLDGILAEVKIYSAELTSAEALADYNGRHKATDLVALYQLDEGTGLPRDTSGNVHHATANLADWLPSARVTATGVSSGEHIVTTTCEGGLDFVRANSDWVSIPDHNDFSFTDGAGNDEPFSIVAWVNLDDASSDRIVTKRLLNNNEWSLFSSGTDVLYFLLSDATEAKYIARGTAALTGYEGDWIHIVATYDGTEAVGGIDIYINGVVADTGDLTAGAYAGMARGGAVVELGSTNGGTAEYLDGLMSAVKIYDVELTPAEALADYNGGHKFSDLVAWYQLEEGTGNPTDSSGNGHDATANLADWVSVLRIYIDDTLEDEDISAAYSVPDNTNDWAYYQNLDDYWHYTKITIGGILQQHIEWEYDTVFTDLSGNSHDATPTFRTGSSDPDVSAVLTSFLPVSEAKAPVYALEDAPAFIETVPTIVSDWAVTPQAGTFPLAAVIVTVANATATPPQLPLLILAAFVILASSLAISTTMRQYGSGSLIVKIITITAVMGVFIGIGNFGIEFWMLFVFLVIAIALSMGSKQVGWQ